MFTEVKRSPLRAIGRAVRLEGDIHVRDVDIAHSRRVEVANRRDRGAVTGDEPLLVAKRDPMPGANTAAHR